ncbi:MAG: PilZ domain-containing protein [bacterium]
MGVLARTVEYFKRSVFFIRRFPIAFYHAWRKALIDDETERLLEELAEKENVEQDMLRLAAGIYQKYNMPEKELRQLLKLHAPNLLQITEDLQTLHTLVSSGAILGFHINKRAQQNFDAQFTLAEDDESEMAGNDETIAILQDKYRVPGNSSPGARFTRRAPRFPSPHRIGIAYKENGAWVEAEARNISRTGLLLETARSISVHDRIKLKLKKTKTSEDVVVQGRVVRKDDDFSEEEQSALRFGISFDKKLPAHPRAFLRFDEEII